jgi:hypothetical protein
MKRAYLLPLLLVSPLACHDDSASSSSHAVLPMVALASSVAYVDSASGTAFLLDPANLAAGPRMVATGKSPIVAAKCKGTNQLLVLTHGDQGSSSTAAEPARLVLVDPASNAAPVTTDLPGRFDQIAQSDDGVFAILYYGSASSGASGSMLYNPNDLAVATLDGSKPLASRPIRSLGSVPSSVTFSPRSTLFGQPRTLAAVLAPNYVTLLDLDHADHTEITVPLVANGTQSVTPVQVIFDMAGTAIYVRAQGSNDIFQISLAQTTPANLTSNDFRVSLSLIGSGSSPSDVAMFGTGDSARLLVTAPDARQIVVLDPKTGNATSIPTATQVNRIFLFQGPSPKSSEIQDRAMLVGVGTGATALVFADLKNIESTQGLALESWSIPAPVVDITPLPGNLALLTQSGYGGATLSIVNLADRTIEPIGSSGALSDVTVEATVQSRLWGTDGGSRLEYLDIVDHGQGPLFSAEVLLDQPIASISPLANKSADGKRYVVLEMQDPMKLGYLTVLNADQPDRKGARSAYGFLLTDYFQRGQP